jgi:hypothetical protein
LAALVEIVYFLTASFPWQGAEKGRSGGFTPPSRIDINGDMAG